MSHLPKEDRKLVIQTSCIRGQACDLASSNQNILGKQIWKEHMSRSPRQTGLSPGQVVERAHSWGHGAAVPLEFNREQSAKC